ncbi:MAG: 30S ribosomal protein S20 [Alphaproteobacteria bacterium]|nr:30S ribosomal protein S20 [Alphaproteobacteria bacterium]
MANIKSAQKRIRQTERRNAINTARKSRIRTFVKKVEKALAAGDKEAAMSAFKDAQPELQRGVTKGVLHKNTVARKISRMNAAIKALA